MRRQARHRSSRPNQSPIRIVNCDGEAVAGENARAKRPHRHLGRIRYRILEVTVTLTAGPLGSISRGNCALICAGEF